MVGNAGSIEMPDWGRMRAGLGRLRGLRCLHTTLGGEPLTRDDLTDLVKLRLDALATMIDYERDTYMRWLANPEFIRTQLTNGFRPEMRSERWGKVMFAGRNTKGPALT